MNEIVYSVGPESTSGEDRHCKNCGENVMYKGEPENALWIKLSGGYGQFIDELPEQMNHAPTRISEDITYCTGCNILEEDHSPMCCKGGEWATDSGGKKYIPPAEEWTEAEVKRFERKNAELNSFMICHECAHALCDLFPAFAEVINPDASHSHHEYYWRENPHHHGWDKPYWKKEFQEESEQA